jgi:prepilin-type N-terminal cleavage/methylation domain-containing protein
MNNDQGFSLVEVVVAAAMLALLSTLLFGAISMSGRAMDAGLRRTDLAGELAVLDSFLQSHLAQANATPFTGTGTGLDFTELSPDWLTTSPMGHIAIRAQRGNDGWRLLALWQGADAQPHESLILERLFGVEFAYFGSAGAGDAPAWRRDWPGPAAPALVKLRLTPAADRPAEEMIVALRLVSQGEQP